MSFHFAFLKTTATTLRIIGAPLSFPILCRRHGGVEGVDVCTAYSPGVLDGVERAVNILHAHPYAHNDPWEAYLLLGRALRGGFPSVYLWQPLAPEVWAELLAPWRDEETLEEP